MDVSGDMEVSFSPCNIEPRLFWFHMLPAISTVVSRPMIRTCSISIKEASIIAVSALDDLVNDLVKASSLNMSPAFLDWVADEATSLVEWYVAHFFNSPRFANSLRMGAPRIAMARWVRHWVRHCVCPRIVVNFDQLAGYLAEFAQSRPAGLASGAGTSLHERPRRRAAAAGHSGGQAALHRLDCLSLMPAS